MSKSNFVVRKNRRMAGQAGHVRYDVEIQTPDGTTQHLTFTGNIFGGPVVVTIGTDDCVVIDDPRRFGEFAGAEWVAAYLTARHPEDLPDSPEELSGCG